MRKGDKENTSILALPIGNGDRVEVRVGYWLADKTRFISGLLELKSPSMPVRVSQKCIDALLSDVAQKVRAQIDEKHYAAEMEDAGILILKYGISFLGKHVALVK